MSQQVRQLLFILLCLFGLPSSADSFYIGTGGLAAERRIKEDFKHAGLTYPPERVQMIAFKDARALELWVWTDRRWWHVRDYPIFAASGEAGPKLREGDRQVPEGFYRVVALNPNSHFHLSLKLDYPNAFDWLHARAEGREKPGSNIYIHGSAWSKGCLAVGNRTVEELYVMVSRIGEDKAHVLIAPHDFRAVGAAETQGQPAWVDELYAYLGNRLKDFPLALKTPLCAPQCAPMLSYETPVEQPETGERPIE
jgi:hypothetical protein